MSNVTSLTRHRAEDAGPKRSVTILNGDQWEARFAPGGISLTLGYDLLADIRDTFPAPQEADEAPETVRAELIRLLDLGDRDVARLDANADAFGLDFATVLRAEIATDG